MKELIPKDEYGIFADAHDTARVDSLFVAEFFEKNHKPLYIHSQASRKRCYFYAKIWTAQFCAVLIHQQPE